MTTLALAVNADDELWTLDDLPTPEAPYVEVESELIEVRSRFPSSYYTLTGETLPPRIRVRRGIAGTTAASHIQGSTLTPNYGLGGGTGSAGVLVDNQSDPPAEVTTLIVPGADLSTPGEATLGSVQVFVSPTDPGAVGANNLWLQTETFPTWWVRNGANTAWETAGAPTWTDVDSALISSPANNAELILNDNLGSGLFSGTSYKMEVGAARLTLIGSTGGVHLGLTDGAPGFFVLTADPTAGAGRAAAIGSLGLRNNAGDGELWKKNAIGDTSWVLMAQLP